MKIINLIFLIVFLSVASLTLSQTRVSAQTGSGISPITSPITYYTYYLKGKITYRLLGQRIPAVAVYVSARNLNSGQTFNAKTDFNGLYTLAVTQVNPSANYIIKPEDKPNITWKPLQYKRLISKDFDHLNFVGTP